MCVIVLTGKAPPNLSQGVPPLLPNQYIMGPGGLLPAYPVSRPSKIQSHFCVLGFLYLHMQYSVGCVTEPSCFLCLTADLWL